MGSEIRKARQTRRGGRRAGKNLPKLDKNLAQLLTATLKLSLNTRQRLDQIYATAVDEVTVPNTDTILLAIIAEGEAFATAVEEWHKDVIASTGIQKDMEKFDMTLDDVPKLRSFYEYNIPFYEALNKYRLVPKKD